MMPPPTVSLIIPCHNSAKYIRKCLNSIQAQTFQDFELIIIDDFSTDQTAQLITEFIQAYPALAIHFVQLSQQQGPGTARNYGLSKATGKYITFIDSDDWVEPSYLETLVPLAVAENVEILTSNLTIYEFGETSGQLRKPAIETTRTYTAKEAIKFYPTPDSIIGKFYKREWLVEKGLVFTPNLYGSDFVFNQQGYALVSKLLAVPYAGYQYIHRTGSQSTTFKGFHISSSINLLNLLIENRSNFGLKNHLEMPHIKSLVVKTFYRLLITPDLGDKEFEEYSHHLQQVVKKLDIVQANVGIKMKTLLCFILLPAHVHKIFYHTPTARWLTTKIYPIFPVNHSNKS